jgi:hypothetical protein
LDFIPDPEKLEEAVPSAPRGKSILKCCTDPSNGIRPRRNQRRPHWWDDFQTDVS